MLIFGTISEFALERITKCQSREVIFVTDQYFEMSIKGRERDKKASTGKIQVSASRQDQAAPKQFKKYLSVGANETELLQFLLNGCQDQRQITTIGEKRIFVTLRNEVYVVEVIEREIVKRCVI